MSEPKSDVKEVQFIEYHKPTLKSGYYTIKIEQKVKTIEQEVKIRKSSQIPETFYQKEQKFHVQGDRVSIPPQTIYGIYPPVGSKGNYGTIMPHIMLNRSTLPWERQPDRSLWLQRDTETKDIPWLALLLFHQGEINKPQGIKLKEIIKSEQIENESDVEISVIDIPKELFQMLLPSPQELKLLTHVRQGTKEDGTKAELAVIISNRLPKLNSINTAHLVSLENNLADNSEDTIRLISLKNWDFSPTDGSLENHFDHLLININKTVNTLRSPDNPELGSSENEYIRMGYTPLLHHLRNGEKTVSWYHGPLLPGKSPNSKDNMVKFPINATDDLLLYNSKYGLFDVSYASAWQIGRLLALQDKNFSINLYNWKRRQNLASEIESLTTLELLFSSLQDLEIPQSVTSWFKDIKLLENLPFNYLVPNPEMLPAESLRFFWIDNYWLDCLIDGAFSIADVFTSDNEYLKYKDKISETKSYPVVTGFLLRSEAVSGYPGIDIRGFQDGSPTSTQLSILRRSRLSDDVLFCLFSGEVNKIQISQKPETLHFGFSGSLTTGLFKKLRNPKTGDAYKVKDNPVKLDVKHENWRNWEYKIVNIESLANSISQLISTVVEEPVIQKPQANLKSSEFALEMVEGFSIIEFKITQTETQGKRI